MVMPSICEDSPAIMTARGLTGKRSTLRTDSSDAEYVNPSEEFYVPEFQPNRRLVKRHKLNTGDFLAQGTRTSVSELASSGRKVDYLFPRTMRFNITNEHIVKNQNESDRRSLVLFKKLDFSSVDSMKGRVDLALSYPWIQRWRWRRHSQPEAQSVKPAARVIRKPQNPRPTYVNPSEEFCVPEVQPNCRLIKRHELDTCQFLAQGTRTSVSELASAVKNVDYLFTDTARCKITSKDIIKNQNESDRRSLVLYKNLDFSSMDPVKGQVDLALSYPWIQRWRQSQPKAQSVKPAAKVIRKLQIPRLTLKKQLPSFAAMALMGRALNRFRPCEIRKEGLSKFGNSFSWRMAK